VLIRSRGDPGSGRARKTVRTHSCSARAVLSADSGFRGGGLAVALSSGKEPWKAKESEVRVSQVYERRQPRSSEPRGTLERAERLHRLWE